MGQAASRSEELDTRRDRSRSLDLPQLQPLVDGEQNGEPRRSNRFSTAPFLAAGSRFSHLFDAARTGHTSDRGPIDSRRSNILQRTQSTFRGILHRAPRRRRSLLISTQREPEPRLSFAVSERASSEWTDDFIGPRLSSIDVTPAFEHEAFAGAESAQDPPPGSSHSLRRPHVRMNARRPDLSLRHLASSLRRRQSPQRAVSPRQTTGHGDQAIALSRLLSAAAAATAATLMGDNQQALTEVRSLTGGTNNHDIGMDDEDGSFESFLNALQNGRIASAMRQNSESEETTRESPLDFFRMFQFGPITVRTDSDNSSMRRSVAPPDEAEGTSVARLVPIIIVGIRAISPDATTSAAADELPPFIDALTNLQNSLPSTLEGHDYDTIDSILRPPQNPTSFRHRRRASMGAFGMSRNRFNDRMDDQRDHRSPDRRRERPVSMSSATSSFEPRPPPATPATPATPSPELSRISSRNASPSHSRAASFSAGNTRDLQAEARMSNVLHRPSLTNTLSAHREESAPMRSSESGDHLLLTPTDSIPPRPATNRRSDAVPNVHYPRFASGHPRRNGVVEPDNLPPLSRRRSTNTLETPDGTTDSATQDARRTQGDSRSWIIYVLGGSYPENHPILTTPSLFTDNPTYEDMMLLSALLGPAKAPVASEEDVQSAGGIYEIEPCEAGHGTSSQQSDVIQTIKLVAVATQGDERILLEPGQRCLVCLGDFEIKEHARELKQCKHLFHKECIDQWLTQGCNSCPLCRRLGVNEHGAEVNQHDGPDLAAMT